VTSLNGADTASDNRFGSFATDPVPTNVRCASNSDCARRGSSTSTSGCSGSIGGTVARSTA